MNAPSHSRVRRLVLVLIVLLCGTASHAVAQDRRDVRLAEEIGRVIQRYSQFTIFDDVNGRVEGGIVTLEGKVTMPYKKTEIERRVARIDGVREMKSSIDVLPVSQFDEDLRYRIARAIYGNPSFWNYAAMAESADPHHRGERPGHADRRGRERSRTGCWRARSRPGLASSSVKNELRTDAEATRRLTDRLVPCLASQPRPSASSTRSSGREHEARPRRRRPRTATACDRGSTGCSCARQS